MSSSLRLPLWFAALPSVVLAGLAACSADDLPMLTDDTDPGPVVEEGLTERDIVRLRDFWPLPAVPVDPTNAVAEDPWAQHFGQFLFFETAFSETGTISCASCHVPELGWADGAPFSNTISPTGRHAPTLLNAGYNRWQFWDGRCDTQWCQATKPLEAHNEMGGDRVAIVRTVYEDARMHEAYVDIFGGFPGDLEIETLPEHARPLPGTRVDEMDAAWEDIQPQRRVAVNQVFTNLAKAIAAFERQLVSRDSVFDQWAEAMLFNDPNGRDLLSPAAKRGYKTFIGDGLCIGCHSGPTFSNHEFHNIGVGSRPWLDDADMGRADGIRAIAAEPFRGSGEYSDAPEIGAIKLDFLVNTQEQEGQFKTPGLRDLQDTGPYLHGGHMDTLEEVLLNYIEQDEVPPTGHAEELLVLITMEEEAIPDMVEFLLTLEGAPVDEALTRQPADPRYNPPE